MLRQCVLDVVVMAGLYAAILGVDDVQAFRRFAVVFLGLNVLLRALQLEYADAVNRGVAMALAAKLIN